MEHAAARRSPQSVAIDEIDPDAWRRRPIDLRWLALAVGALFLIYLSMLNRYWVPSGDGEIYTCIARSLARGQGLMFNGSRAAIEPPGWPIVMSLLMRITPEFWFLKLFQICCMTGSMALSFLIVRRYVSDRAAAGIILLTGTLSVLYPLTFWMHTEAFFCLLGFGALLIAFRIRDGLAAKWEIGLMLVLLGYAAFTRWSGALYIGVVAPILLSNFRFGEWPWRARVAQLAGNSESRRRWTRRLGLIAVVFLVGSATFVGTHKYLKLTKQQLILLRDSGGAPGDDNDVGNTGVVPSTLPTQPAMGPSADETPPDVTFNTHRGPVMEVVHRVGIAGIWFAWLLWQPTRFGQSIGPINAAAMVFGWLTIALLAVTMIERMFRHRDYFWIGLAAYTGGLCVLWDNPNPRYFVPVAPFIVLGVYLGLRAIRECAAATTTVRWPGVASVTMAVAFTVALLVSNLPLLAIDIGVFRSKDFYAKYEAGANQQLIQAAQIINQAYRAHPDFKDLPIGLSTRYTNLGRERYSPFGQRALHLLCDQIVLGAPKNRSDRPNKDATRAWGRSYNLTFYIYQQPWYPWRVWHFRLSESLQAKLASSKKKPTTQPTRLSGGWELWARVWSSARFDQVDLPPFTAELKRDAYPTRVPGM